MKTIFGLVGMAIVGVVLLGVNPSVEEGIREPLKIGVLLCLTGQCADWGNESLRGATLAVKEINATGGILGKPISLVVQDSAEDSAINAVRGFQNLRSREDVNFIIGPTWSPAGLAVAPLVSRDTNTIMISPSLGVKEFNEMSANLFNLWPHDETATRHLARYAFGQGWRKVAILGVQHVWTETQVRFFKEEFIALGGTIVADESPLESTRDLRAESLRVVKSNPDAILLACFSEQQGIAAHEIANLGYRGPKMSILLYPNAVPLAKGGLEGTIVVSYAKPGQNFVNAYQTEYKTTPKVSADVAYDVIYFYQQILNGAGTTTDTEKILQYAQSVKQFSGASGVLHFDGKRGVTKEPVLYSLRGSELIPLR